MYMRLGKGRRLRPIQCLKTRTLAAAETVGLGAKISLGSTVLWRPTAQPSICLRTVREGSGKA